MQRVRQMICVSSASERCRRKKFSHNIDDKSARLFVDIVEHGGSIECVIEIMTGLTNTYANSSLDVDKKSAAVQKLIRNKIVRESALFCALLGVNRIMLVQFGVNRKFDKQKDAVLWLELSGYSKLARGEYRYCVSAWTKQSSVAKIKKMPSGKFLVQEFKTV